MITPETLLEQCITNYTLAYALNYSTNNPDMPKTVLLDSIAWTSKQLRNRDLITQIEYENILAMAHSKDKENLYVAEQIIRNLKFKL
jgi:hypothetical protein